MMLNTDDPNHLLDEFREFQNLYYIDADKPPFYTDKPIFTKYEAECCKCGKFDHLVRETEGLCLECCEEEK